MDNNKHELVMEAKNIVKIYPGTVALDKVACRSTEDV